MDRLTPPFENRVVNNRGMFGLMMYGFIFLGLCWKREGKRRELKVIISRP